MLLSGLQIITILYMSLWASCLNSKYYRVDQRPCQALLQTVREKQNFHPSPYFERGMNKRTALLQQISSSPFIWITETPLIHHCRSLPTQDFSWLAEKGDRFLIKASLLKRHKVCSWAKTDQPFFFPWSLMSSSP